MTLWHTVDEIALRGAMMVARVDGDYFAVMGLPLQRMVRLTAELGLGYRFGAITADA